MSSPPDQTIIDFLIYSPQKTGSTSLAMILKQSPDIRTIKNGIPLEPMFFHEKIYTGSVTIGDYNNLFDIAESKNVLYFEKSTQYFETHIALSQIIKYCKSNLKYIVVLRNPVDRFISEYIHFKSLSNIINNNPAYLDKLSYEEGWRGDWQASKKHKFFIEYPNINDMLKSTNRGLSCGLYHIHISRLLESVDRNNIYFIKYENFKQDNKSCIYDICKFLNISMFDYKDTQYNESKKWITCCKNANCRDPSLDITLQHKKFLYDYYFEPNKKLDLLLPELNFNY